MSAVVRSLANWPLARLAFCWFKTLLSTSVRLNPKLFSNVGSTSTRTAEAAGAAADVHLAYPLNLQKLLVAQ